MCSTEGETADVIERIEKDKENVYCGEREERNLKKRRRRRRRRKKRNGCCWGLPLTAVHMRDLARVV